MTTIHAAMRSGYRRITLDTPAESGDRSTDAALDGNDLECVAVHPDRPERVFLGTFQSGLWRSRDGGQSFERVGAETSGAGGVDGDAIGPDAVMSAAVTPDDPDEIWVGTEPSRVYRSMDGGDTWTELDGLLSLDSAENWSFPPRPHTHHVRWLEPDPHDSDHWYVAIEAGALVQTHDDGATWEDRVPDSRIDNHSLATHPDAPNRAWVAAGDGYAETHDGGQTWDHPQDGLDRTYCWSVAVDPGYSSDSSDHDRVLLSAARSAREAHTASRAETYVYRRADGGRWERLDESGLPMGSGVTRPVLCRGESAGEFYALSNRGLWRTTDGGGSWTEVGIEWPERFEEETARGLAVV